MQGVVIENRDARLEFRMGSIVFRWEISGLDERAQIIGPGLANYAD